MQYIHRNGGICSIFFEFFCKKLLILVDNGNRRFVYLTQLIIFKVVASFFEDDTGKSNHADKVGDSHEAVGDIGEVPHHITFMNHATDVDGNNPKQAVGGNKFASTEVFQRFLTVVRPAQEGGYSKGGEAEGEQKGADGTYGIKGREHVEV